MSSPTKTSQNVWPTTPGEDVLQIQQSGGEVVGGIDSTGAPFGNLETTAGLTSVSTDTSLSGKGTPASPLSIASVTTSEVSGNNLTLGLDAGTSGSLTLNSNGTTKTQPAQISNGNWYPTAAVPYFRPTTASTQGILDVMSNGSTVASQLDAWIDVCSTDITLDSTDFECVSIHKYPTYSSVGSKAQGTGTVRPLAVNEFGGNVTVGGNSSFPAALFVSSGAMVSQSVSPSIVAGALTINAAQGNTFRVVLTANVTSMTITNPVQGQIITILWVQSSGGSQTVAFASNLKGATAPSSAGSSVSVQQFTYDSTNSNWYAVSAGVTGM
jgi:hypothetical protein